MFYLDLKYGRVFVKEHSCLTWVERIHRVWSSTTGGPKRGHSGLQSLFFSSHYVKHRRQAEGRTSEQKKTCFIWRKHAVLVVFGWNVSVASHKHSYWNVYICTTTTTTTNWLFDQRGIYLPVENQANGKWDGVGENQKHTARQLRKTGLFFFFLILFSSYFFYLIFI